MTSCIVTPFNYDIGTIENSHLHSCAITPSKFLHDDVVMVACESHVSQLKLFEFSPLPIFENPIHDIEVGFMNWGFLIRYIVVKLG